MGEIRINVTNFVTIGLIAFASVFAVNKLLTHFNKGQYRA